MLTLPLPQSLALKNIFGQKGRDGDIRQVDHITDTQIDRNATDDIGLFSAPTALLEQLDHVDQGVAGRERQILTLLRTVLAYGHTHGGNKIARGGPFRGSKIPWMRKARPADIVACRFPCLQAEAHHGGGAHLNGRDAAFGVTLCKMPVTRRVEGPVNVDWDQQARAFGKLLGVHVATVFTRWQRPQALLGNEST